MNWSWDFAIKHWVNLVFKSPFLLEKILVIDIQIIPILGVPEKYVYT